MRRLEAHLLFLKFLLEDLMRMSYGCNEIWLLNPIKHLPFSLHLFDLLFSIKPARWFMKFPLPSLRKLPSNIGSPWTSILKKWGHSGEKGILWATLIQNHFREAWSCAPQIFQSLGVSCAFSMSAFSTSPLFSLMGAGQKSRALSQI